MAIVYHNDLIQGEEAWHLARLGTLTASEMHLIITPTLKVADNDKTRAHVYELLAQRVTGYVEPSYISDAMLRGWTDEIDARELYSEKYAPITEVGFVTNDKWGFKIGYSPDGLVGDDGLIECKSRMQKLQMRTIVDDEVPAENIIQIQTGLLVTGRKWCDYCSYSGGMPFYVKRVFADRMVQEAIILAAAAFEAKLKEKEEIYCAASAKLYPTERKTPDDGVIVV